MALRKIFTDDAPCLYKTAKPVTEFNERLHTLLDDMKDTMYNAEGVGLAAPQVGVLRRVFVIDVGNGPVEFINPKIISTGGVQGGYEGCLSFPERRGYVERPNCVVIRAFDRYGNTFELKGEELMARALLHENDHLDGKVYLRLVKEPPEGFKE
ncbi:MAG: peptide deformylase [Clostridia bacterium]|nr:peptide deformylase [Clostridia bacterium]